jgi:hypothetical protein
MPKRSSLAYLRYFLLFLALTSLACGLSPFSSPTPTPTPEVPASTLYYNVRVFTYNLEPGSNVPGTRLEFVSSTGDSHQVRINGQDAVRQTNESFLWDGIVGQGVFANYRLRLAMTMGLMRSQLVATGPVELYIFNPEPEAMPSLDGMIPTRSLYYANIPVSYGPVPVGGRVPGTTLVFEELTGQGVRLSGTTGYPYWAIGDTVHWQGRLRENVFVRLRMPISQADERGLRLGGEAEIWVVPPAYQPPRS